MRALNRAVKTLDEVALEPAINDWQDAYAPTTQEAREQALERSFSALCAQDWDDLQPAEQEVHQRLLGRLLAIGANPNRVMHANRDDRGTVPIDLAALLQKWPVVKQLIEGGADPYRRDCHQMSLMDRALYDVHVQGAHLLLDLGLDVDRMVEPGMLVYRSIERTNRWSDEDRAGFIQRLIAMGHPIDPPQGPDLALAPACYYDDRIKCLDLLIQAGADPQVLLSTSMEIPDEPIWTDEGWTLLHVAAVGGQDKVVERLLGLGLSVNVTSQTLAMTPLHAAALGGNVRAVDLLIKAGAALHVRDHKGRTPLDLARKRPDETYEAQAYLEHLELSSIVSTVNGHVEQHGQHAKSRL